MNPAPRKKPCAREGCGRTVARSRVYCCAMCAGIDNEFSRLQAVYGTDATLNREAWMALVDVNDQWTAFVRVRGALYKDLRAQGADPRLTH